MPVSWTVCASASFQPSAVLHASGLPLRSTSPEHSAPAATLPFSVTWHVALPMICCRTVTRSCLVRGRERRLPGAAEIGHLLQVHRQLLVVTGQADHEHLHAHLHAAADHVEHALRDDGVELRRTAAVARP